MMFNKRRTQAQRLAQSQITGIDVLLLDTGITTRYYLSGFSVVFDDNSKLFGMQQELIDYLKEHVCINTKAVGRDKDAF